MSESRGAHADRGPNDRRPAGVDVLVVGGGPAGNAAARRAADLGASVVLVEARHLGGTCVNTGCVPTRVLAKAARLMREVGSAGLYGIEVGDSRLDWARTVERVRAVIDEVQAGKDTANRLRAAGVQLHTGCFATFVDDHTVAVQAAGAPTNGAEVADGGGRHLLRFDRCIICVGGHSRRLPIPGAERALFAEHVLDLGTLPSSVAVIGSGSTGSQLVTILNAFGSEVTLLEVADRIMPTADADVADTLTRSFRSHGVDVVTGLDTVAGIDATDEGLAVDIRKGEWGRTVTVDAVVMAAGWPANLDGLQLEATGVHREGGVVPVNDYQQTNVPHIYVAGDANGQAMLVQSAESEGEAAAANAVLGPNRHARHGLLPWGGFTDPDVAGVGLTEDQARRRDPSCIVAVVRYDEIERAIIDHRTEGFLKLIADRRRSLLLGAHAAGESAVEVIQAVTTAMAAGVDVATLARVEFAYPTYTAIVGAAARRLLAGARTPAIRGGER